VSCKGNKLLSARLLKFVADRKGKNRPANSAQLVLQRCTGCNADTVLDRIAGKLLPHRSLLASLPVFGNRQNCHVANNFQPVSVECE
jgi:hypothetical protein